MIWLALEALALLAFVAAELWLRRRGVCDFPLFRFEEPGVYRAAPNQAGKFLGRLDWRYDERGMRAPSLSPSRPSLSLPAAVRTPCGSA